MRQILLMPIIIVLISIMDIGTSIAQQAINSAAIEIHTPKSVAIYFRFNRAVIDSAYMSNSAALKELDKLFANKELIGELDSITIISSASPEGVVEHNNALSLKRALAVKKYMAWKYPIIKQLTINICSIGENWEGLKSLVEQDKNTPYRAEVLRILNQQINQGTKEWRLRQIGNGSAYRYITNNFMRYLRSGAASIVLHQKQKVHEVIVEAEPTEELVMTEEQTPESIEPDTTSVTPIEVTKPYYLLVKTNLLYDVFGVANLGAEIRLSEHYSLDIPLIYSPYTISNKYRLRILALQPELRFWLKESFEGHFVGIQGTVGWFNVAIGEKNRYQDNKTLWSAGLTYGYAMPLAKNWGAEFLISGGYADYSYDIFYNIKNGAEYNQKAMTYWGVTRVGINLIYKFNLKK